MKDFMSRTPSDEGLKIVPPVLEPMEDADKKRIITKDIDNHLYSFTEVHGRGMDAMAHLLHRVLNKPIDEVKASMGRVYNQVGTFDFKELVENMDIVIEQIVNNMMNGYRDCNKGALHVSKNMVAIVNAAKRVYQKTVAKHLRPYHGVLEMMEGIVKDNREIVGLTDAPKVKTITRLRALKLLGFFKHLYAQPTPKLEPFKEVALECKTALIDLGLNPDVDSSKMIDQLMGKIESNEIDGKTLTRLVELIHKVYDVHRNPHQKASAYITEQCEAVLQEVGHYETDFPVTQMRDQRKPNIDLSDLYGMSRQEVSDTVVMCGDNPKSDMQLAVNNRCVGIYSQYGQLSQIEKEVLQSFGQKKSTENRNLESGDAKVVELQSDTRNRIYIVIHPIQILDLLDIERPDEWKTTV